MHESSEEFRSRNSDMRAVFSRMPSILNTLGAQTHTLVFGRDRKRSDFVFDLFILFLMQHSFRIQVFFDSQYFFAFSAQCVPLKFLLHCA